MDGEEKMKKFFRSDLFLRIASLFIAILLWIFVVYQENPIHEIWINSIPVNFINRNANFENGKLIITDGDDVKVNIKVQGRRSAISKAKASNVNCSVNLADIDSEGIYTLPITVNISSYGVEMISKEPYNVTITVDRVVTEERVVEVNKTGAPKSGFVEGTLESTPASVKITGPESTVRNVASASISLDLTDASEDIAGLYKIRLYDAEGKEITDAAITKNIEYCDVKCPILATREISVTPELSSDRNSQGHRVSAVSVSPEKITLIGRSEQLERIDKITTKSINTWDINGTVTVNAELDLGGISEGVLVSDDIKSVKIELKAEPDEAESNGDNTGENSENNTDEASQTAN